MIQAKPGIGVNLVAYMDARDPIHVGIARADLRRFEQAKDILGDAFQATARLTQSGVRESLDFGNVDLGSGGVPREVLVPTWRGTRIYEIRPYYYGVETYKYEEIGSDWQPHSPVINSSDRVSPTAQELEAFFGKHFKPDYANIVYISGHGDGEQAAGIHVKDIGYGLFRGGELSGVKPDIVILNCCMMATTATLSAFGGAGAGILAAVQTLPGGLNALTFMYDEAFENFENFDPSDMQTWAKQYLRNYSLLDMERGTIMVQNFQELTKLLLREPKLEQLQEKILEGLAECRASLRAATDVDIGFGDFGKFLSTLRTLKLRKNTVAAISSTEAALQATVITQAPQARTDVRLSGISFPANGMERLIRNPDDRSRWLRAEQRQSQLFKKLFGGGR